jgi:hypothetical protein
MNEKLNKKNAEVVEHQRKLCLADFNKIQDVLGEYKDLVQMYGSEVDESGGQRVQFRQNNIHILLLYERLFGR